MVSQIISNICYLRITHIPRSRNIFQNHICHIIINETIVTGNFSPYKMGAASRYVCDSCAGKIKVLDGVMVDKLGSMAEAPLSLMKL